MARAELGDGRRPLWGTGGLRAPSLIAVLVVIGLSPGVSAATATAAVSAPSDPDISFAIPNPITLNECRTHPQAGALDGWIRDPYNWCRVYGPTAEIVVSTDPRNPGPVGEISYAVVEIASGSNTARSVTYKAYVDILGMAAYPGNPVDLSSINFAVALQCHGTPAPAGCHSATTEDSKTIGAWKSSPWTKQFTIDSDPAGTSAPSYVATGIFYPTFTFSHRDTVPDTHDPSSLGIEAGIRFDSAGGLSGYLGKKLPSGAIFGTVNSAHAVTVPEPQLTYGMAPSDNEREVAQHIYVALNSPDNTYPRVPRGVHKRFSATLERLGSEAQITANRAVSTGLCAAVWGARYPTAYGRALDCDEYPFASTYQGGTRSGINLSVCPLGYSSNRSAGTQLKNFYATNRVLDGEPFKVKIDPAGQPLPTHPPCPVPPPVAVINLPAGGAFAAVWAATGGARGPLGTPLANWRVIPGGEEQDFAHGSIFWSQNTGTHEVHGAIIAEYGRTGGPGGRLGFPTSNEQDAPGGGRENTFAGESCGSGSAILWSSTTGAHEMQGCIYDAYMRHLGGSGGGYGFPTSDELATKGAAGQVNYMSGTACGSEHGSGLFWSPNTAALPVQGCIFQKYEQIGEDQSGLGFPTSGEFSTSTGVRQNYQNGYMLSNGSGTSVFYSGSNPSCADYGPYATGPHACNGGFSTGGPWFGGGGVGLTGNELWTYANGTTVDSTAVYHLSGLGTNRAYQIQAYIPNNHSDATHAHYRMSSPGGGTANGYVDQESYTNAWAPVGYVCTSDGTVTITLADDGEDNYPLQVGADAIRAVPSGYACPA
jgi:hypothetical protein